MERLSCECDNTHQANDTVCQWCWARGRRHWNDEDPGDIDPFDLIGVMGVVGGTPLYDADGDQIRPMTDLEELDNAKDQLACLLAGTEGWDARLTYEQAVEYAKCHVEYRQTVVDRNPGYVERMALWKATFSEEIVRLLEG